MKYRNLCSVSLLHAAIKIVTAAIIQYFILFIITNLLYSVIHIYKYHGV